MIALDTNVLVRFLTQDDAEQSAKATALIEGATQDNPAFLSREVLVELVWVLDRCYGLQRQDIAEALDTLLSVEEFLIEAADDIGPAIHRFRQGGFDFSDVLIVAAARRAGADALYTFDRKAARLPGAKLLG